MWRLVLSEGHNEQAGQDDANFHVKYIQIYYSYVNSAVNSAYFIPLMLNKYSEIDFILIILHKYQLLKLDGHF